MQALKFEGFTTLSVTGKGSTKMRVENIAKFMGNDPETVSERIRGEKKPVKYRVLILSSVGNAGLNLHCANALIFVVSLLTINLIYFANAQAGLCVVRTGRRTDNWARS